MYHLHEESEPVRNRTLIEQGRTISLRALRGLADVIVPPACLACREPLATHDAICASCWQRITFIRPPLCDRLGIPLPVDSGGRMISAAAAADPPAYDRARAVAHYTGVMRDMIARMKYADTHDGRRLFGRWLSGAAAELIADCDMIIPVPMHRNRLLWRRFNQSALLAKELAGIHGIPYQPMVLQRTRATRTQVGLTRNQRLRNLSGAFAIAPHHRKRIEGRHILIVDDVITTGTTLNAVARTLKRAGAASVDACALAMVTSQARIGMD